LFPAKGHHACVHAKQEIEMIPLQPEAIDLFEEAQIIIRQ
jgi:hypothetical protein